MTKIFLIKLFLIKLYMYHMNEQMSENHNYFPAAFFCFLNSYNFIDFFWKAYDYLLKKNAETFVIFLIILHLKL